MLAGLSALLTSEGLVKTEKDILKTQEIRHSKVCFYFFLYFFIVFFFFFFCGVVVVVFYILHFLDDNRNWN